MSTSDTRAAAEQQILTAAMNGITADFQLGDSELDDPASGASWGTSRTIDAKFLEELLIGDRIIQGNRIRRLHICGARITGPLVLQSAILTFPLALSNCYFDEQVFLAEATAPAVCLRNCHIPGIEASQLRTEGNVDLRQSFITRDAIILAGARIGGALLLDGAQLIGTRDQAALIADMLTVEQNMLCTDGFSVHGELRLLGAQIKGELDLGGADIVNEHGAALIGDGCTIGQNLRCSDGFTAQGGLHLIGAHIGASLELSGAKLANEHAPALIADGCTISRNMTCTDGFTVHGGMSLVGAHIEGSLELRHARLENENDCALIADQMTVETDAMLADRFIAHGEVRLRDAHIGGNLDLSEARLINDGKTALSADRLIIGQDMNCNGLNTRGEVRLWSARIGGALNFIGTGVAGPDESQVVVDLHMAEAGALRLFPASALSAKDGIIDLTNAKVGAFYLNTLGWKMRLRLGGFIYDSLELDHISVKERLTWLMRHTVRYTPQAYDQLAAAYRRAGQTEAARKVAIAKQWHRRATLNPARKAVNWLLYLTVGYGYRTWLAGLWLAGLIALGTWLFGSVCRSEITSASVHSAPFHPLAYTLSVLLPFGNFAQQGAWLPQDWAMYWSWIFTACGWALTTTVVGALTGVLKRE